MEHQKPAIESNRGSESGFLVSLGFDDVDHLSEVARSWDLDLRRLNPGTFDGAVVLAGGDGFQLSRTRFNGVIHQCGSSPPGMISFAFSAVGRIDHRWRGCEIGTEDLMVHQSGGELESTSRGDFDIFVVSLAEAALVEAADRLEHPINATELRRLELVRGTPAAVNRLRRWCAGELAGIDRRPSLVREDDRTRVMREDAAGLLLACLENDGVGAPLETLCGRRRFVNRAVAIARERANSVHTVGDLARRSGASERTLRRGFNERFGVSPKTYLQVQRLIGVRRNLRSTGAETPISDIANAWGFWHMGQFAADYRRQFGELPSETTRC